MKSLIQIIKEAEKNRTAIGHFNISNLEGLKAIFEAAKELNLPVIIGTSEGERDFIGTWQAAALIKSLREEFSASGGFPIFLNADHTRSLEKVKESLEAGYDMVHFDGSLLPYEENIKRTKEAADYIRQSTVNSQQSTVIVEGELGYLRGSSELHKEPIEIKEEDLTKPEQAKDFIEKTGVDLLAIAVGNIHGIIARTNADWTRTDAENPPLNIKKIREIKKLVKVPLVLHGGSGIPNEEISAAIEAGISIIHINTELRLAWRRGLERAFKEMPEEIAPYKILPSAIEEMKEITREKLKLFNRLV